MKEVFIQSNTVFISDMLYTIGEIIRDNSKEWMIYMHPFNYIIERYNKRPSFLDYDITPEECDWEHYDNNFLVLRHYCGMILKVDGDYWFLSQNGRHEGGIPCIFWYHAFYTRKSLV